MEKYGVMPKASMCPDCGGTGRMPLGKQQWSSCHSCGGTGRIGGKQPDPIKEAEQFKKEKEGKSNE